jgi:hypothetical protein
MLDGTEEDYERFEKLVGHMHPQLLFDAALRHGCSRITMDAAMLPLPKHLLESAIAMAQGVLLDLFVSPYPGDLYAAEQ